MSGEELRAAADALIDAYLEACEQTGWSVERDTVMDLRAALAAPSTPEPSGLVAALDGLARSWDNEATRRAADEKRRDDPTNLLALGIFRAVAQELRAALAARDVPENQR